MPAAASGAVSAAATPVSAKSSGPATRSPRPAALDDGAVRDAVLGADDRQLVGGPRRRPERARARPLPGLLGRGIEAADGEHSGQDVELQDHGASLLSNLS